MAIAPSRFLVRWAAPLSAVLIAAASILSVGAIARKQEAPQSQAAIVEGTVRNAAGEPVSGASVTLTDKSGTKLSETQAGASGEFRFVVSPAGTYSLRAEKVGEGRCVLESLALSLGETKRVNLVLAKQVSGTRAAGIDFADSPSFIVAGVNDGTDVGGHGSDTTRRTSEALARETLELKPGPESKPGSAGDGDIANRAAGATHRLRGEAAERSGDPIAAVREYELAVRAEPSEENYFDWGAELLLHGAPRPAAEVFSNGAKAHASSARMLAGLGAALYASGSPEEAARRLCQASDLNPADPAPYLLLGKIEKSSAAPLPCSDKKLKRFAQMQPENALANYYYGMSLARRAQDSAGARQKEAEAFLERAIALDPKLAEAHLQLGVLYAGRGDTEHAVASYQNAIAADPALAEAHYRLGLAYKRSGENAKAERQFELYRQAQKAETAAVEARRRELRQFLIILKDQPAAAKPR